MGISPSATARAIAQGVREANDRLAGSGWPLVGRLTLVELYLDRAAEAWRGLQVLATASPDRFELAPTIASGTGPLRWQIDSGYRGADYDFITATAGEQPDSIAFTLDTRRARTEMRAQRTQGKLLRDLVTRASTDANDDPHIGRTLFQLLVPAGGGALPGRHPAHAAGAGRQHRAHPLGAAGDARRRPRPRRPAALGHPQPAAAQAAQDQATAPRRATPVPKTPCW